MIKILTLTVLLLSLPGNALAEPDFDRLADAIYRAEGGAKTNHPYGILAHYRHTTAREACRNTCKHQWRLWEARKGQKEGYLEALSKVYAPIGAANDPRGLNAHWLKNVRYYYNGGE